MDTLDRTRQLRILVINPGSSSLKASLIDLPDGSGARVEVDWGADASRGTDRSGGVSEVLAELGLEPGHEAGAGRIDAVGYRVVHGGPRFTAPVLIDDAIIDGIGDVRELAPLHNGVALETIEAGRALLPDVPQVACFDTAFHATLEPAALRYPVPEHWYRDWGIRRYGFHGLSVAWSVRRAGELLDHDPAELSMVVAHLGSGSSVTAVEGGRSVDTSMGLTPLEGLMMGTRSGSVDPGVLLHLLRAERLDVDALAEQLDHASGLAGVSALGTDMRELQAAADGGDERAQLAITMFEHRAAAGIAAVATSLPGLDALVFTGGIGEHAVEVRRRIVDRLGVLGVPPLPSLESDSAATVDAVISAADASVATLRVAAREDLIIASETAALIA